MGAGRTTKKAAAGLVLATITFATATQGQEQSRNGLEFGISQTLRYTDNLGFTTTPESSYLSDTNLSLAYRTATRSEQLSILGGVGLEFGDSGSTADGIDDPFLNVAYNRDNRSSSFRATFGYQVIDTNSTFVESFGGIDFIFTDVGQRTDVDASAALQFGQDARLGGEVGLSYGSQTYDDTIDPDFIDRSTAGIRGRLNFAIDPTITAFAAASFRTTDTDGGIDRENIGTSIGADVQLRSGLSFNSELSFDRNRNVTDNTETEGFGLTVGLNQELPNGSLSGRLQTSVTDSGRRTTLSASRNMETRGGNLSFTLGASISEDTDIEPVYGLAYAQELTGRSRISVGIDQSFLVDDDGDERIDTALRLDFNQALTSLSSIGARIGFQDTNVLTDEGDTSRLDLSLRYNHELARDWGVVGGYTYSRVTSDTVPTRTSNTLFVGLEKTFLGGF